MTRKLLALVLGVGVLVSAAPIVAHHSVSAEFDTTKTVTFTGKVTEVNWGNPHIYTSVEATDPDTGKVTVFKVEGGAPNALFRNGWRKDTLKIGETVSVTGNRAKNPASPNIGQARILTESGRRVYAGNANAQATP
jgi:DNA/RNA endonuclease YhcR with UshA esterase domain